MFIPNWLTPLPYCFTLTKAILVSFLGILFPLLLFSTLALSQNRFLENGGGTQRGPDAGLFADTPLRQKIDLSGRWNYTLDGQEWNSILVPSAYDFSGKVTFQRTFDITEELLDRYTFLLVAYGINYQSDITINGSFIGRHIGGYTTFVLPIPDNTLQVGNENVITIVVDNELTARTTLPLKQPVGGWRTYGGIIRDIYFLAVPKIYIVETEVRTDLSSDYGTAKLQVRSLIENRGYMVGKPGNPKGVSWVYRAELYDKLSGVLVGRSVPVPCSLEQNKVERVRAEVVLPTPKLWSPASPDIYVLKCFLVRVGKETQPIDEYDLNIGMTDLKFKEHRIVLNGEPLTLNGVVWREDHPEFGAAMTYEALEKDIAQIKGLGANLIRVLNPPHPYILNLCDRYGLLVMEEIPLVGVPSEITLNAQYWELVANYLKEMVVRDRNHVSVFAWGLGDDLGPEWSVPHACQSITSMRELVSSLDTRQTYYGTSTMDDQCLARFGMLTVNIHTKDVKEFRKLLKEWRERHSSKPIIVARYGEDVEPGNRNGYSDPLSLEWQARYGMQSLDVVRELKLAGSVWWSFNDWRGDRPAVSTYSGDPFVHAMGLVGYNREKRIAYDVIRSVFNGEKVAALPIGNYSSSAPIVYVIAGLVVLIVFAFLYNSNRRFRENVHRSLTRTYNFFADVRDQRILNYGHSTFLAAVIAVTWATVLSSIFSHYRDSLVLDNLLSQFMPDSLKEWFVRLVWQPPKFILIISGILFFQFIVLSLIVQLCSLIARTRVSLYHSISVVVWSMLPNIILIPIAMILYRVMEIPLYILPAFILMGILVIWTTYRLLKGVSVIFDVYPLKVYVAGILIIVSGFALLYGYLDYTQSMSAYLKQMIGASFPGTRSTL